MLSHLLMSDSATSWTVAHQVPLSVRFSRQEYWSGLPFPSPGDLPDPGIKPVSFAFPALAGLYHCNTRIVDLVHLCPGSRVFFKMTLEHIYCMPQFSSVAQSCPTLCDPMNRSTPGLPVHNQLPEFKQTHVH